MTTENESESTVEVQKQEEEQTYPPLKDLLIQYTGTIKRPQDNSVTLQMIIETVAEQFPEFVMMVAEENFVRGYKQALHDVEVVKQIPEKSPEDCNIETDIIEGEFKEVKKDE